MFGFIQGLLSFLGRVAICGIFVLSAVGGKIMNFQETVNKMQAEGIPMPNVALIGAIGFILVGSLFVVLGFRVRLGAFLLLVFLGLATYYFHDFWKLKGAAQQAELIHFLKNSSIAGALLFLMANGGGAWSFSGKRKK